MLYDVLYVQYNKTCTQVSTYDLICNIIILIIVTLFTHCMDGVFEFIKKGEKCTAPKKLDTIWGHFYGKKSQV